MTLVFNSNYTFKVLKLLRQGTYILINAFSIYNMGTSGLPDMYIPRPEGQGCTYQVDHECPFYKYYVTLLPTFPLWFTVSQLGSYSYNIIAMIVFIV